MVQVFLELLGQFIGFSFVLLIGEAAKHWGKSFDKEIFFKTNVEPLFWVLIAGIIMAASVFIPEPYNVFLEKVVGGDIDTTNMDVFYATAATFAVVLKSVFGKPTEVVKKEIMLSKIKHPQN